MRCLREIYNSENIKMLEVARNYYLLFYKYGERNYFSTQTLDLIKETCESAYKRTKRRLK